MKITGKLFLGLFLVFASLTFVYAAVNMQEGEWEISMEIKMEGMPFQMPPMTFKDTQCLTKEDMVPKTAKEDEKCEVKEQKIIGNKAIWKVHCIEKDGSTTDGTGEITYSGNSYQGVMNTKITDKTGQSMTSTTKMTGRRLGACKK